jgi:hypothetical protein
MSSAEKFIILPYRKNRGNLVPGEMRQASSVRRLTEIRIIRKPIWEDVRI